MTLSQSFELYMQLYIYSPIHSFILYLFIHSRYLYSASSRSITTQRRSRHSTDTMSEFHAKAPQPTASAIEGLAQGPYVAARAGFEPTTLRSTAIDSTNEPTRPQRATTSNQYHLLSSMCVLVLAIQHNLDKLASERRYINEFMHYILYS